MHGCNADTAAARPSDNTGHDDANGIDLPVQSGSDSGPENLGPEGESAGGRQAARVLEGTGLPAVLSLSVAPDG